MSLILCLLLTVALRVQFRGDLLADLGAPFLDRLEPLALAAIGLGLAVELVRQLVEVDLEAQGLRHIPRRVAEHLDLIALRVLEIDRPGVAMADRADALATGFAHLAVGALHGGEVADIERDMLYHWGFGIGGASAHQYDLMMVARVAGQECDAAVGCPVADNKA